MATKMVLCRFVALAAVACLLRPGAPVELHRKLSGWSDDAGATWYGAATGAGSDGESDARPPDDAREFSLNHAFFLTPARKTKTKNKINE
jgi:hypothetical protein